MNRKVALHNLGCKVNAYETEAMGELLKKNGYTLVPFDEGADVYIINTCSVTNLADRKSRQMLHKSKKLNPDSVVVAVGCYVQTAGEELKKDEAIDLIIGNDKKKDIVEILDEYIWNKVKDKKENSICRDSGKNIDIDAQKDSYSTDGIYIDDINDTKVKREFEKLNIESMDEHTRAYIKIEDGCNQFCTYCIIPYARGRVRSREIDEILNEVTRLAKAGYKEVVLTGIHLSSYGIEKKDNPLRLIDVIERVAEVDGIERIRLGSLEPRIITTEFMDRVSKLDQFCPHFHLSLQSGCDETLQRMNRKYTTEEYLDGTRLIRKYYKDAAITTDVIVGFPDESEEEFSKTKAYLELVNFSQMHIFKYSKRAGTKAAAMKNQVPDTIKALRSDVLIELNNRLHREFIQRFIGRRIPVLFEEKVRINGENYVTGHTMEYLKVVIREEIVNEYLKNTGKAEESIENEILDVKLIKALNDEIILAEF